MIMTMIKIIGNLCWRKRSWTKSQTMETQRLLIVTLIRIIITSRMTIIVISIIKVLS